jgi:molybdopterin-guanine dinucleotide biosynthesis protein A
MSAVILAGGESRRMGRDKAWIEWNGRPLIDWAVEKVRRIGVEEVFISGRPDGDYCGLGCPVLVDLEPGLGPLGGIERGLFRCMSPLLLVLAVDLPQMTPECLGKLTARCDRLTGVVPQRAGRWEPLAAIYPKRCHSFAFGLFTHGLRAAHEFVDNCLRGRAVKRWNVPASDAACFANWNCPDDMA